MLVFIIAVWLGGYIDKATDSYGLVVYAYALPV